jgi:hypothetical protein
MIVEIERPVTVDRLSAALAVKWYGVIQLMSKSLFLNESSIVPDEVALGVARTKGIKIRIVDPPSASPDASE